MKNSKLVHFFQRCTDREVIDYLLQKKLIKSSLICIWCTKNMSMKTTKDSQIGYNWRCLNCRCIHYQTTKSVFTGSLFYCLRAHPRNILMVLYCISNTVELENISLMTEVNMNVILKVKNIVLDAIDHYFDKENKKLNNKKESPILNACTSNSDASNSIQENNFEELIEILQVE